MHILQRLVKKGLLNAAEIPRLAEARGPSNNRPLHEFAVERGLVKEEDVLPILAEEFGMEFVDQGGQVDVTATVRGRHDA